MGQAVGRGMYFFSSLRPVLTIPLPIPPLCLSGRVASSRTTIHLDQQKYVYQPMFTESFNICALFIFRAWGFVLSSLYSYQGEEAYMWPEFHNGVAAGLRIVRDMPETDSTWIAYNKPPDNGDAMAKHSHAGFLMALGLLGHLV